MNRKIIVWDTEILRGIPPKNGKRIDHIEYCEGWHDHANMGVACVAVSDLFGDSYRLYFGENVDLLEEEFKRCEFAIGYNNRRFDNKVIMASGLYHDLNELNDKTVDLLEIIWSSLGLDPNKYNYKTHSQYGLGKMCEANFSEGKTGYGGDAPVDWQEGRYAKTLNYCMDDVRLTKRLALLMLSIGKLINLALELLLVVPPYMITILSTLDDKTLLTRKSRRRGD